MSRARRIVAVADTDSYVKWAAALVGALEGEWDASLLVLETPLVVSDAQLATALVGSGLPADRVTRVTWEQLVPTLRRMGADVVLLAGRGPLVRVLAREIADMAPRPVMVTGLPGISIPATRKAIAYRTQCDLFVLHSRRECRDFAALAREKRMPQRFGLASLPFARNGVVAGPRGTDLVFAAQAKVPAERADRLRVAEVLRRAALADPARRVVVKLRAAAGEQQTHAEQDSYPDLLATLGELPPNLVVSTASMAHALATAEGLVTVSSTAAIEAVGRGIPVIALDTFGVGPELINEVLADAGLLAGEADVVARRFRHPEPEWLDDNYFHDPAEDDWTVRAARLIDARAAGLLTPRAPLARRGGVLRDVWERKSVLGRQDRSIQGFVALAVGVPARAAVRWVRRFATVREPAIAWGAVTAGSGRLDEAAPRALGDRHEEGTR
ncbi:DUF6716 putative glycosyltransferase [Microbacterium sp. SSM24]|uniref:DUF6716 putative glycosyltransferase n=1 Tax=Microbacterium sp. SSM24 TaxID=2991714 RepID=UPI0022266005|nr:DUF6716 putative glycosyltransferase [Microbacterium sp. SSM24]MCW3494708.1 hypothetical protein [Microbacterium sp. SSM24]